MCPQCIVHNCLNTIVKLEKQSLKPMLNKRVRPFYPQEIIIREGPKNDHNNNNDHNNTRAKTDE